MTNHNTSTYVPDGFIVTNSKLDLCVCNNRGELNDYLNTHDVEKIDNIRKFGPDPRFSPIVYSR